MFDPRRGADPFGHPNMLHKKLSLRYLALCAAALPLLFAVGCEHHQEDELTKAVVQGERQVAMEGTASFFAGAVSVRVTVSRGIGRGYKREKATFLTGGSKFDASAGSMAEEDANNEEKAKESYDNYTKGGGGIGSPLPPVTLHLYLVNNGAAPVTVHLIDFNSDLGNFAIDPDTLVLAPGVTSQPTAMVSQLGVSSDQIPFTVTLKIGSSRETQKVAVKNLLDASGNPKANP